MPTSLLLDKTNAPLNRLALHRLQLDASSPYVAFETHGTESLLYSLVGSVTVSADGVALCTIGGRRSVTERGVQVVRFPAGRSFSVVVGLQGFAADLLLASVEPQEETGLVDMPTTPYLHLNDAVAHDVGQDTYRREVRVVPQPAGFSLYTGETLSHGGWSSFPAHATADDRKRYAEWEESFFLVTNGAALIHLDGIYCTGEQVNETRLVHNSEAFVTPLGSHPIVMLPKTWGVYWWGYIGGHVLEKTYNRWATDTGVYLR